ncbi:toprim domain-containing protein [Candidatus Magnetaquicoccus inordinatus]|uniref:toprim domain-containing protein n=1 Tax=Candidatus Magnetaquicoccus inordinatus TaxID=2496818 RepID=UPI00102D041E|nr:toprim domain-containing protein [Candidatus Magnetaquicoccus inordinatus]
METQKTPGGNRGRTTNYQNHRNNSNFRDERQGDTSEVKAAMSGRWLDALPRIAPSLAHAVARFPRHVPCPIHGGKDGLRLYGDASQTGGGVCNTCGVFPDGIAAIMWANGWDFPTTMDALCDFLGWTHRTGKQTMPRVHATQAQESAAPTPDLKAWQRIQTIAEGVVPLTDPAAEPARLYLYQRGIGKIMDDLPDSSVIGFHQGLMYWHERRHIGDYPALVARVQRIDGATIGLHCTYLSDDGSKADVPGVKKLTPKLWYGAYTGAAVRLYPLGGDTLHLTEGVETALAVRLGTGGPVWACLTAGVMENVQLPREARNICIWADLDASGAGQRAAHTLADHLASEDRTVRILTPPGLIPEGAKGLDWLDILTQWGRT